MAKSKTKSKKKAQPVESDAVFFLKLVLYFVLGTLCLPIPVGLVFGVLLAQHDHFQIDRKIEYAVLLIATIVSFFAPVGFVLAIG
jgi:ABC-type dipeptide/oligopeptide/nickel transport system permease component